MNTIVKKFIILVILCSFSCIAYSQTFHAIVACNTIDRSIGTGMVSDMKNMSNAIQIIAANLNCEFEMQVFDGNQCTKKNIIEYIDEMEVGRDDVILFFYGGHGTHAENNANDPWPQMCMNTNIESLFMPVKQLDKLLGNKQPKLRVILTNCCNKEQSGVTIKPLYAQSTGATMLGDYNAAAFKKLFLENQGKVMMTSSKLGQYSWCGANGGLFTNYLLDVLDEVGKGKIEASWDKVCQKTHDKTLACNSLPGGAKQEPYFETKVNGKGGRVEPKPDPVNTDDLFEALQIMVSQNLSKDQRLAKMSTILNKHFTSDAHVVTVGRNGTSKIAYEEAEEFLRRLALSNNIKQVNILEGSKTGKNSIITVHEVRY